MDQQTKISVIKRVKAKNFLLFPAVVLAAVLAGCSSGPLKPLSVNDEVSGEKALSGAPLFVAHGASTGNESLNSMRAIRTTLARDDYDGIEVDVVLTGDSIPVLAHDPWLSPDHCRRKDGKPFQTVLIRDVYYEELIRLFECRFDSASSEHLAYHELTSLAELLEVASGFAGKTLYLDLKIHQNKTLPADEYAAEIHQELIASGIENPIFIEVPEISHLKKIKQEFSERKVTTVLSYPAFYAGEDWDKVGALSAISTAVSSEEPLNAAQKSGADMIMSPTVVMSYKSVRKLHDASVLYGTFLVSDKDSMKDACNHGADLIITDIAPGAGCGEIK